MRAQNNHPSTDVFGPGNLMRMLEAKTFPHVEKVLPFLGTITDRSLHETSDAPNTRVLVISKTK